MYRPKITPARMWKESGFSGIPENPQNHARARVDAKLNASGVERRTVK
jgi:hypothetical protein